MTERTFVKPVVWVKRCDSNADAFSIPFVTNMNIDELKSEIQKTRRNSFFVEFIYSSADKSEEYKCRPSQFIKDPINGEIGSSDDQPYYYTIENQVSGM